ncbi:MAG: efflux RND transporter periplasmic adaptor subunit [Deltaproteobacteria bacterium]|nr:efflux RND transporter periplasmic adaptor subunit [Deltaproteobacteria bacterium]MBM4322545.1 efflux RND transporter periplasmic adaptor subunit [Deltaproteobacteria bacterium]
MANEDLSKLRIEKTKAISRPRRRRKIVFWVLLAVAIILSGFLYIQGIFTPPIDVQIVTVSQIYPSQTLIVLNASGYVVPQRKSALASKVTGRLIWLGVEEGNRVKQDQIVARLESQDVTAAKDLAEANVNAARYNIELARAELREATLNLERNKALLAKGYVAKSVYDSALARYEKAVAAVEASEASLKASLASLEAAKINLEYTLIRAPFDAVVLTKNADVGDIVTPIGAAANAKSAVITIADMNSLQVEADVSESNLNKIKVGQPCEIQLDALPGERFRGAIHMIVPTADRTKATVMVKIRFLDKDNRVLPEMSAKVAFLSRPSKPEEQKPRMAINQSSIVNRKGSDKVFLIKENKVIEIPVNLGVKIGDMVEVLSGIKVGDQIILNPPERLRNGLKIKAVEK